MAISKYWALVVGGGVATLALVWGGHSTESVIAKPVPAMSRSEPRKTCGPVGARCLPESIRPQCHDDPDMVPGTVYFSRCGGNTEECFVPGDGSHGLVFAGCIGVDPAILAKRQREYAEQQARKRKHEADVATETQRMGAHRAAEARKFVEMQEAAERARAKAQPKIIDCFTKQEITREEWLAKQEEARARGVSTACPI